MKVPWTERPWNRVVVYGLGLSGVAAARLLRSRQVSVLGVDGRDRAALDLGELERDSQFELYPGGEPDSLPEGVDGVVVSPGVPASRPLLQAAERAGIKVVGEVELGFQFARGPIIGITGSNGKSTTTMMTARLLEAAGFEVEVCGNIGVPLSARVDGAEDRIFVTELSSFQLETTDRFRPRAAALINVAPDHLDRYIDRESYLAAKLRIFANQQSNDVAVLNAEDRATRQVQVEARRRFFSSQRSVEDGCYLDGDIVVEVDPERGRHPLFDRRALSLPGLHNLENAMAAALLSQAVGADPTVFPEAVASFEGLPHRLERVVERFGVVWFDDSKATNFAATEKSLAGFEDQSVHLILGGRNKGDDPVELVGSIETKVRRLYLIGEFGAELARRLGDVVPSELCDTLDVAVEAASRTARAGEVVLLSPGCASFDQYRNFAERGDHFQDLVRAIDG